MNKIKNSQLIMLGIIIVLIALFVLLYNYFLIKKNNVYSKMNIRLYESEEAKDLKLDKDEKIENDSVGEIETPKESKNKVTYNYIGMLEIPKINLKKGFLNVNSKYNHVDYNVTVVNTSTYPDVENGNLILAGHNGNAYNSYFGLLHKLVNGDLVYVYYKNIKYEYEIVNCYDVLKTGTVNIYRNFDKTTLTLITCKDYTDDKQIVYIAQLVNKTKY